LQQEDKILFDLLKREVAATLMQTNPGMNPDIADWKGRDIIEFQEDLRIKVNGQLSEKWFYTHMKSPDSSLPRIDVLNMLSQYAGYSNWNDFRFMNQGQIASGRILKKTNNSLLRMLLIFITVMILIFILIKIINTQSYRFTFIDADTGDPVLNSNIRAELLLDNESPASYRSDAEGSIVIRTSQSKIKMIIRAPYYIQDTVTRFLKKFKHDEQISLNADSYALMIHYFSQTDVKAWQRRREQLDKMISEDAMIYQIPDQNGIPGMELYNKQEFIDKLTMPSSSLRQIDILDCRYLEGQIALLRFRINKDE
jgi:hypothetical protein